MRPSGWEKPGESGPKLPGSQIPTRDEGQAALALETESRGSEGGVTPPPEQPGVGGGWAVGKGPFPEFDFSGEVLPNFNSKEKEVSLLDMSVSCSSKQCIRQAPGVGPEPRAPTSQASRPPGRRGPPAPGKLSTGLLQTLSSKQLYRVLYIYTKIDPFIYARVLVTGTGGHD